MFLSPTKASRARRHVRPRLDHLEGRALLTAGALDPTFGTGGSVLTSFRPETSKSLSVDMVEPMHLLADGSILVAGQTASPGNFGLVKLSAAGALDPSFGSGGRVETDFLNNSDYVEAMAVRPDGKIVVAGTASWPLVKRSATPDQDFGLVRYNPNGSLDFSFGGDGKVTTNISPYQVKDDHYRMDVGEAVAFDGTRALVAGVSYSGAATQMDLTLVRYLDDGSLDATFGSGGVVVTPVSAGPAVKNEEVRDLVVQPDGKALVLGFAQQANGTNAIFVARYDARGVLDPSFDGDGIAVVPNAGTGPAYGRSMALLPDGTILVGGGTSTAGSQDILLVRLTAAGAMVTGFGVGGIVRVDSGSGADESVFEIAVQPQDGKIVAAGRIGPVGGASTMVARFLADGRPDPTFGAGGFAINRFHAKEVWSNFNGVAIGVHGQVVAAGTIRYTVGLFKTNNDILVARFLGDPVATASASSLRTTSTTTDACTFARAMMSVANTPESAPTLAAVARPKVRARSLPRPADLLFIR